MHLGNGTVTPACAMLGLGIAAVGLGVGTVLARRAGAPRPAHFAAGTAVVFAAQALNLPVAPQVCGHLVGGFLLAYWFGAGWGLLATTIVLIVQSLLLGDGGWLALGLNVLNMGILPCLVVYPLWRRWFGNRTGAERLASLALAAMVAVMLSAAAAAVELAGRTHSTAQWTALLQSMLGVHALISLIEAGLTLLAIVIAERLGGAAARHPLAAPAAVAGLTALAVFGSCPWADGLGYALERHSIGELGGGLAAAASSWQSSIVPGAVPSVVTMATAVALTGLIGYVAARLTTPQGPSPARR